MNIKAILISFILISSSSIYAQDPRITQFGEIPIVINPANTGNFIGHLRVSALYNNAKNGSSKNAFYGALVNNLYTISVDQKFGKNLDWSVGVTYLGTGGYNYILSGKHVGLSFAKNFNMDKTNTHKLRLGAQLTYNNGKIDERKGGYSILLDVGAFKYKKATNSSDPIINTSDYFNWSAGAVYQLQTDKIKFETGVGLNNIFKPNFGISYEDSTQKRLRSAINTSFIYQVNSKNSFKIEQFAWKEGFYLRGPIPKNDSADITDAIYGVSWLHYNKIPVMAGLYTRSSKSIFVIAGLRLTPWLSGKLSYEFTTNSQYYPVTQFGLSLKYILSDRKKKSVLDSEFF